MQRTLAETLERKLVTMWPEEAVRKHVISLLAEYGSETSELGEERVRLAILKLSESDADALPELVEAAKRDYRDVLLWAEYPEEARAGAAPRKLSPSEAAERSRMGERDRKQYEDWLKE